MSARTVQPPATKRAERTRELIVDSLLELIRGGESSPSASDIAARAGVSLRSIYVHFPSLQELHLAAVAAVTRSLSALIEPIDADLELDQRIDALCRQRALVNEELAPVRRAANLHAAGSPALLDARRTADRVSRTQITRLFEPQLESLGRPLLRRVIASLDAALGPETWMILRTTHALSIAESQQAVAETIRGILLAATGNGR